MEELCIDKLRNSAALQAEIAYYDRCAPGTPDRSYQFMLRAVRTYLTRRRIRENKAALERTLHRRNDALPAYGPPTHEALADGQYQLAAAPPGGGGV